MFRSGRHCAGCRTTKNSLIPLPKICTFTAFSCLVCSQLWKPPNSLLHEGFLTQYHGDSHKWKENYFILLGDCRLECFDSKEVNVLLLFLSSLQLSPRSQKPNITVCGKNFVLEPSLNAHLFVCFIRLGGRAVSPENPLLCLGTCWWPHGGSTPHWLTISARDL